MPKEYWTDGLRKRNSSIIRSMLMNATNLSYRRSHCFHDKVLSYQSSSVLFADLRYILHRVLYGKGMFGRIAVNEEINALESAKVRVGLRQGQTEAVGKCSHAAVYVLYNMVCQVHSQCSLRHDHCRQCPTVTCKNKVFGDNLMHLCVGIIANIGKLGWKRSSAKYDSDEDGYSFRRSYCPKASKSSNDSADLRIRPSFCFS